MSNVKRSGYSKIVTSSLIWAFIVAHSPFALSEQEEYVNCIDLSDKNTVNKKRKFDRSLIRKYEGSKIGKISIKVGHVFDENDPSEDKALYRLANKIQVSTNEETVRNQLLFSEGDILEYSDIEESMRIVYGREYLIEAALKLTRICDDIVDMEIFVRDAWVIEPLISFGRTGGENSSGLGFRDGNFLGMGDELTLAYEKEPDRSRIIYRYKARNLFKSNIEAELYYAEQSDGVDKKIAFDKPFYSTKTQWSYGAEVSQLSLRYKTRFNNLVLNEFIYMTDVQSAYIGYNLRSTSRYSERLLLGWTNQEEQFSSVEETTSLPDTEIKTYPWIELQRATNTYKQYDNFDYIGRVADIPVGTDVSLRLGQGELSNGDELYRIISSYSSAVSYSESHFFRMSTDWDLSYNNTQQKHANSKLGLNGKYYYFIDGKNKWYVNASYDQGSELDEYQQLTLGENEGVRGYPLAYQRGDKRYVVNLERRFYSDVHWFNLIRFGALVFADFGRAWGLDAYPSKESLRSVGLGLRFHSSKVGTPSVLHLNVGFPLSAQDDINQGILSVAVEKKF